MTIEADNKKEEHNDYDDIELTIDELEKYFVKTVEETQITDDIDKTLFDEGARWLTYYINPPCGLSVKINNTLFSYSSQRVEKLVIYESGTSKRIYCYDRNDHWLEDVDILTQEPYENIRFIFEYGDLKTCSTTNKEQQSYVELYEQLSPYMPVEENRKTILQWFEQHQKIILDNTPQSVITLDNIHEEDIQALKEQYENNHEAYKKLIGTKSYKEYTTSEDTPQKMTNKKGHINCEDSKSK